MYQLIMMMMNPKCIYTTLSSLSTAQLRGWNNYRFTICIFNNQKSTKILSVLLLLLILYEWKSNKHVQKYYPSSVNDFHLNQLVYENREQISISKLNQVTYNVYDTTK